MIPGRPAGPAGAPVPSPREVVHRRRGHRLLAGEPRGLRGVRLMALSPRRHDRSQPPGSTRDSPGRAAWRRPAEHPHRRPAQRDPRARPPPAGDRPGHQHPRPRLRPHVAADAVPAVLRDVQGRDQEHVDRRRDRLLRRPGRPRSQADAGREAPDQPPGRVLRHRRLDRGQQPGAQPLPAHQRARSPDVPVAPALRRGAARPVLPDAARQLHPRHQRAGGGLRRHREHPVDPGQGRVLLQVDGR